jgi:hypothetical protein
MRKTYFNLGNLELHDFFTGITEALTDLLFNVKDGKIKWQWEGFLYKEKPSRGL